MTTRGKQYKEIVKALNDVEGLIAATNRYILKDNNGDMHLAVARGCRYVITSANRLDKLIVGLEVV